MKKDFDANEEGRLRRLLQIKRLERPDDARWKKFDLEFDKRRLRAIVSEKSSFIDRILAAFASRRLAHAAACLCLVVTVVIGFGRGSRYHSSYTALPIPGSGTKLSYVRDDILCNVENVDLKTQLIRDFRGVAYVCDAMSSRGAFVR
jgi:hypothetical protein